MSTAGTWCDNIIIQAVSSAFNCISHITESDINKPDGTVITPVLCQEQPKTLFIGYINPFAPGDFAEKCVLKLVEWFSGHCRAIKS